MTGSGDDSISGAVRIQGYALLLMGSFPPSLKKKLLFKLLNEMQVKMSEDELKTVEAFYEETPPMSVGGGGYGVARPVQTKRCDKCGTEHTFKRRYCDVCGTRLTPEEEIVPGYPSETKEENDKREEEARKRGRFSTVY